VAAVVGGTVERVVVEAAIEAATRERDR